MSDIELPDQKGLQAIADAVETEWGMGGLSSGLYGDYAIEIARRAVAIERERCARVCEEQEGDAVTKAVAKGCAAAIRRGSV